jgi:hypothetical protein
MKESASSASDRAREIAETGRLAPFEQSAQHLPIGSGEIESGHRHVIQKRLKVAGAWWKETNAHSMLNLRTARANHQWKHYWISQN